jgi:branched-chain amino acid transport system substrate-binding protein
MQMLHIRRTRAFACVAVLAVVGAACGSDDDSSSKTTVVTTAAAAETTAAPADTTAETPADSGGTDSTEASATTEGSDTTEGTDTTATGDTEPAADGDFYIPTESGPADTSLDPVKIGFVNQSEGTPSFAGPLAAAKVAVDYINDKLGGIEGHPLELVDCNTGLDPDSNQKCAQQMVNDDGIQVITTQFVLGSDAFWPVLEQAGLVGLEGTPLNPTDLTSPAAIAYSPGPGTVVGLADYAVKQLGAKSLTIVAEANNGGQAVIDNVAAASQMEGIDIKSVLAGGADTDLAGALQANPSDAYVLVTAAGSCVQVAKALEQIGSDKPVLAVSSCSDGSVISEVGAQVSGWYVGAPSVLPGLVQDDPELALFTSVMDAAGHTDDIGLTSSSQTFGQLITLWELGNKIGFDKLSRDSWKEALLGFTGPVFLGPRKMTCLLPGLPALCTTEMRIMQITDDGLDDVVPGPYDAYAS